MTTLYAHQVEAIDRGKQGNVALFHDCGTGKTLTAIRLIEYWKVRDPGPALVVCPLSIIDAAWLADVSRFAPSLDAVSLWSKKPSERQQRLAEEHDIYIANYETLKGLYPQIIDKSFSVLIVDESSKMKNQKSQITQALLSMAGFRGRGTVYRSKRTIPHRYVLSGTPAPNDEAEYWAQIKFVTGKGDDCFNQNFYAFRGRYFYSIPLGSTRQVMWRFRKQMRQEFMEVMRPFAHVVRKADALDLPPQVHEVRHVELSTDERKAYKTMKRDLVLQFAEEPVLASTALVEVMKLRQLTSGFCYGDLGTHQTGKSKMKELRALLDELGNSQVIIWANFKHEIAELLKMLPNSAALWSGTTDRAQVIEDFRSGRVRYLVANPMSAAHGLTFTNCNYAIYFSLNYSYEFQKQSQDRIHRIGQNSKCTYFYLIARDTIDEVVYKTVKGKAVLSNSILSYLKGTNGKGMSNKQGNEEAA